jgi:uncharacterized protein YjgD (DUF1641 family)
MDKETDMDATQKLAEAARIQQEMEDTMQLMRELRERGELDKLTWDSALNHVNNLTQRLLAL